jgi:tetratricopeptide (TPR) repeat protein
LKGASYFNLGMGIGSELEDEYWYQAKVAFEKSLQVNPKYYNANVYLVRANHNIGNYVDAASECEKISKYYPDSIEIILLKGVVKCGMGDIVGAKKDLITAQNLIKDSSYLSDVHRFLGYIFEEQNKTDSALFEYTRAIEYSDKNARAFVNRGYLLINSKDGRNKGCEDLRTAAKLGMKDVYKDIVKYCN